MLESLLENYGYWVVLFGTMLEGETILVIGGFVAHRGYLSLAGVIVAAFAGTVAGDQLWFYLGRRHGSAVLARRPVWQRSIDRVDRLQERYGAWMVLAFRFFYGLRTLSPFALGMSHMSSIRFSVLNALGAALWAVVVALLGYFAGEAAERWIENFRHYEVQAILVILAIGIAIAVFHVVRRRRRAALGEA